jgi:hypothetical protein
LKADFDDVFKVFVDLLRNPEFRADKLELAQASAYDGISRRNDDMGGIASREALKLAYGADNPYARQPEYTTIGAGYPPGFGRLAQEVRSTEQHHYRNQWRLRLSSHGSQAARSVRFMAQR